MDENKAVVRADITVDMPLTTFRIRKVEVIAILDGMGIKNFDKEQITVERGTGYVRLIGIWRKDIRADFESRLAEAFKVLKSSVKPVRGVWQFEYTLELLS